MNRFYRSTAVVFAAALWSSVASSGAGQASFGFTGGSLVPTLTDVPAGVTVDTLVLGTKFSASSGIPGNIFDDGGGPDSIRITAADGTVATTGDSLSAGTTLAFSVHIPAGITVSFQSLSIRYKGTNVVARSNARVFSSIRGSRDAAADTVGIFGRDSGGTDSAWVLDTINLTARDTGAGGNIGNADFTNLTNQIVTFTLPWMDGNDDASSYIDLDDLTLTFVSAPVVPAMKVTDFQVVSNAASISFNTEAGKDYTILDSEELTGPAYRKHWAIKALEPASPGGVRTVPLGPTSSQRHFFIVAESSAHPVARIMPVGDSITEGNAQATTGKFYSYRGPLYDKLRAAGYHFEYVGTRTTERTYNSPLYGAVTLNHLGQGGANAATVRANLAAALPTNPADIVLIHSGHNYDLKNNTETEIIGFVESATRSMIVTCRSANPRMVIVLAQVITSPKLSDNSTIVKYAYIPALNVRLAEIAAELNTPASPIIIVNQAEGWNTPTDAIGDLVHPSQVGAEKMAQKWFDALAPLLE